MCTGSILDCFALDTVLFFSTCGESCASAAASPCQSGLRRASDGDDDDNDGGGIKPEDESVSVLRV